MRQSNYIHETAIIAPTVTMGKGNYVGPFCILGDNVMIGDGNRFEAYVSIGLPAEHIEFFEKIGSVVIGNRNVVREFCTINSSTTGVTRMGDDCIMLRGSHLSHDSTIENFVTLSCGALVGGKSTIMRGANIGLGSVLHQHTICGSFVMVGMNSVVTKKTRLEPGGVYVGSPARSIKMNVIGLVRNGIDIEQLAAETRRWELLRMKTQ